MAPGSFNHPAASQHVTFSRSLAFSWPQLPPVNSKGIAQKILYRVAKSSYTLILDGNILGTSITSNPGFSKEFLKTLRIPYPMPTKNILSARKVFPIQNTSCEILGIRETTKQRFSSCFEVLHICCPYHQAKILLCIQFSSQISLWLPRALEFVGIRNEWCLPQPPTAHSDGGRTLGGYVTTLTA